MSREPGGRDGAPLRIAYVLGTTAGGTGPHVAMLAQGCAARGMAVQVFGPAETGRRYFREDGPPPQDQLVAAGQGGPPGSSGQGGPPPAPSGQAEPPPALSGQGGPPPAPSGQGEPPGPPGFTAVEMAARPRPARDLAAVLRLRRLLRDWAPDLVHAHGLRAGAFAALAQARLPIPLVVTVHNAPPATGPGRFVHAVLERLTARRADAVTWVSGDLAARMRRAGARDAGRAVIAAPAAAPPGPDQVAAAKADLGAAGGPAVFAAGRLSEQKGFAVLIDAAARWQDHDPAPRLAIAGAGPLAGALAGQARAAGVPVRFLGQRGDVPALMAAADVVVVPSLWEGQPLVVQEALRARPAAGGLAGRRHPRTDRGGRCRACSGRGSRGARRGDPGRHRGSGRGSPAAGGGYGTWRRATGLRRGGGFGGGGVSPGAHRGGRTNKPENVKPLITGGNLR